MATRQGRAGAAPYDPLKDAEARYPEWAIKCVPLGGIPEVMCLRRKVILIDADQRRTSQRAALSHAVAHLDLDHGRAAGLLDVRQELAADKLAARRLLPTRPLVDALRWSGGDPRKLAAELGVERRLLDLRMLHLRPLEREVILRALDIRPGTICQWWPTSRARSQWGEQWGERPFTT